MILREEIVPIIDLYRKYGWEMAEVLLTKNLSESLGTEGLEKLFADSPIRITGFDGIWFRRNRNDGYVAWELRRLDTLPFALCESVSMDLGAAEVRDVLKNMEERMAESAS